MPRAWHAGWINRKPVRAEQSLTRQTRKVLAIPPDGSAVRPLGKRARPNSDDTLCRAPFTCGWVCATRRNVQRTPQFRPTWQRPRRCVRSRRIMFERRQPAPRTGRPRERGPAAQPHGRRPWNQAWLSARDLMWGPRSSHAMECDTRCRQGRLRPGATRLIPIGHRNVGNSVERFGRQRR